MVQQFLLYPPKKSDRMIGQLKIFSKFCMKNETTQDHAIRSFILDKVRV